MKRSHTPGPWELKRLEPVAGDVYWIQSKHQICIAGQLYTS